MGCVTEIPLANLVDKLHACDSLSQEWLVGVGEERCQTSRSSGTRSILTMRHLGVSIPPAVRQVSPSGVLSQVMQ